MLGTSLADFRESIPDRLNTRSFIAARCQSDIRVSEFGPVA